MFGWVEVYLCTERTVFFQKQDILAQHRIKYKGRESGGSSPLGSFQSGGQALLLGRDGLSGGIYRIFVKRKDAEQAKRLLGV